MREEAQLQLTSSQTTSQQPTWMRFLIGMLASAIALCMAAVRAVSENSQALDNTPTMILSLFLGTLIVVFSGLLSMTSRERDTWRLAVQGLTLPGVIVATVFQTEAPPGPNESADEAAIEMEGSTASYDTVVSRLDDLFGRLDLSVFDAHVYALESSVLNPPGPWTQAWRGVGELVGRNNSGWQLEAARTDDPETARQVGEILEQQGLDSAVYKLAFTSGREPRWTDASAADVRIQYSVLLGKDLSASEARKLRIQAKRRLVGAMAWQEPAFKPDREAQNKALMRAVDDDDKIELVRLALLSGADPNYQEIGGETPLIDAAEEGNLEIVKMLIEAGADLNLQDDGGETALIEASEEGRSNVVSLLLEAGADFTLTRRDNRTAFQVAAEEGNVEVVRRFMARGVSCKAAGADEGRIQAYASSNRYEMLQMVSEYCDRNA